MPPLIGGAMEQPNDVVYRVWPHAPAHLFAPGAVYIVTAGVYQKALLFNTPEKRDFLLQTLFDEAQRWGWSLQAWAILSNHYHFVAQAPAEKRGQARGRRILIGSGRRETNARRRVCHSS